MMQRNMPPNEILIEREMRLPECSPEERRLELEMVRDNLDRILEQADTILETPEKFHCLLHAAHLGLVTGPSWQIPLGVLLLLWKDGKLITICPHCAGNTHILGAGGSPLSGANTFTGICVNCREIVTGRLADFSNVWHPLLNMRAKYRNYQKVLRRRTRVFSWKAGLVGEENLEIVIEAGVTQYSIGDVICNLDINQ
jgi:hypothetical protein